MNTNIERILESDIKDSVTQLDAIFEAVTNSIHSNSTQIKCYFNAIASQKDLFDHESVPNIESMRFEDDGEGFTEENLVSFDEYRSGHKVSLGCKGVGRFVFLKLFHNVKYTSYVSQEKVKRSFVFSTEYDNSSVVEEKDDSGANKTILTLSSPSTKYFGLRFKSQTQLALDLKRIRDAVFEHLLPTLYFFKQRGKKINIEFINEFDSEDAVQSITSNDVPQLNKKNFSILDRQNPPKSHAFELSYIIEPNGRLQAFHCANYRKVTSFSDQDLSLNKFGGVLFLESKYFDKYVNDTRNSIDIWPKRTTLLSPLSWEMINEDLQKIVREIVEESVPDVVEKNASTIEEIENEHPYLMQYINEEDVKLAGFIDKKNIVTRARNALHATKDYLIDNSSKDSYSLEDLDKAVSVAQSELVAYIQDRILVIERFKNMINDKERVEKKIHDLFMQQRTDSHEYNYGSVGKNNLWLLDDRFTSYSYAASDKRVSEVLQMTGTGVDADKPDLSIFFSQDPDNKEGLNAVIVEFKSFDYQNKPARKKKAGVEQLLDYIEAFQKHEKIESIWAFLVTDVDAEFEKSLRRDGYEALFSTDTPIFHRFYPDEVNASIYVIGAKSILSDAEARNKVFMDIIKRQSSLSSALS